MKQQKVLIQSIGGNHMSKKSYLIIGISLIISIILSYFGDYSKNDIISYDFILNMEIGMFSVSLAIVALIITILEKYKEKVGNDINWAANSSSILKELCENTIGLLIIVILLILFSIADGIVPTIPKFDLMTTMLITCTIISLLVMLDTTWSIYKLVINLKDVLSNSSSTELYLSQHEQQLIEAYRFLDQANKEKVDQLLTDIATAQQIRH